MNTPFRFVHTADLHLDSPLRSLALRDTDLAERIDNATRRALTSIVTLCIERQADALLIAGDLYDGEQKSMYTAACLGAQMRRLRDADIPVYIIRGNHDAAAAITSRLALPDNVHVFDGRGSTRMLHGDEVAIHGVSFSKPAAPESLLPKFPAPRTGCFNIGLLHTSLGGSIGHDVYAPSSATELARHGYDYWALGHIHKRQVHGVPGRVGEPLIVMPGNPQGRDIGEDGPRSVTVVDVDEHGMMALESVPVGPVQFERLPVDISDMPRFEQLPDRLLAALADCRQQVDADELVARVELVGATDLVFRVRQDRDLVLAMAREAAAQLDHCAIDKVDLRRLSPPVVPVSPAQVAADIAVVGQLGALINDTLFAADDLRARARDDVAQLVARLPVELRPQFGHDEAAREQLLDTLMREGSEWMLAALEGHSST